MDLGKSNVQVSATWQDKQYITLQKNTQEYEFSLTRILAYFMQCDDNYGEWRPQISEKGMYKLS